MNTIREKSKSWTYKRGFIEGAHKILLFSKSINKYYSSALEFLREFGCSVEEYLDYDWNYKELVSEREKETVETNEAEASTEDGAASSKKIVCMKYDFGGEKSKFDEILARRIFLTERIENLEKALKDNGLLKESELFLIENKSFNVAMNDEDKKTLAEKISKEIRDKEYLWYRIYQSAQTEYQAMDYLRGKWFNNGKSEKKTQILRALLEDEEEIEGFANLTDYLNSLMTVKYVLECACVKGEIYEMINKGVSKKDASTEVNEEELSLAMKESIKLA
eukprot:TRINITY_DN2741_c0_g1_i3.p1 TRINITY_DN2741_c0_g1~~TRINITY_DN2741_c0_g1_i3.p1  ORF type:complete len:278 (+),score=107.17 TRINITY_DN2741_c0_g1_i3:792-1625(+)